MHNNVTQNGQKIFIYRNVNGWTNISLDASANVPKLTCDPITTLITAWREFTNCAAVSTVKIKWHNSDTELDYDDIAGMETQFESLPDPTNDPEAAASASKTEAEVLFDMIQATDKKIDDCVTKLAYIVDAVDKIARSASDAPANPATPNTEGSTRVAGKRKATK